MGYAGINGGLSIIAVIIENQMESEVEIGTIADSTQRATYAY